MTSRELREKRAAHVAEMQKLIPADGSGMSAEARTIFDKMDADEKILKADIDRVERADALAAEVKSTTVPPQAPIGEKTEADNPETRAQAQNLAFRRYLRVGESRLPQADRDLLQRATITTEDLVRLAPEIRDLAVGTTTLGGWLVPQGFWAELEKAMKWYGPMLQTSRIVDTATGNALPWPTLTDVSNVGQIVGEADTVSEADPTIGRKVFGAYKFSTKAINVSFELLQDAAFDVETEIRNIFAERLGRILNTYFTTGTGSGEPEGIVTGATSSGVTVVGDDNATTPDPINEVGSNDLLKLIHKIDPAYRTGSRFMFHDNTLLATKLLKDKYGRPLWLPGVGVGAPDTIHGFPYAVNNDMAQLGSSAKSVLFGQLNKYIVRRVKELFILRLDQINALKGQVVFVGFARYDGALVDAGTHPVQYLTNHS